MKRNVKFDQFRIKNLVPDLPKVEQVLPLLEQIDQTQWYSNFGPLNDRFEKETAQVMASLGGAPQMVSVSNATIGLRLALQVENLPEGAKVLLPAITFPATALAVKEAGLVPVIADVDADSWELTPEIARQVMKTVDVAAVMPVAVFGYPLPAQDWAAFAKETGVRVVMDAAAAFGTQALCEGVSAVFSLHATKPMGVGEGGLYATFSGAQADRFRKLSNFGFDLSNGLIDDAGTNAKMSEMMAAVGLKQLERRETLQSKRAQILDTYRNAFKKADNRVALRKGDETLVPATFMVDVGTRKAAVAQALTDAGIQVRNWYLPPMHKHPAFKDMERASEEFPVAEMLEQRLIGLPFHSFLTEDEILEIAKITNEA